MQRILIEILLLGAHGHVGALLRLTSLEPPTGVEPSSEVLFEPGQLSARVELPFRSAAPRRYRSEGQLFLETSVRSFDPSESRDEVLVLDASGAGGG